MNLAKIEVFRDNKWVETKMKEIKAGDKFRVETEDGIIIEKTASCDAYVHTDSGTNDSMWAVMTEIDVEEK